VSAVRAFGPGRVNLIGEHTDYNDGLCLPFAIAAGVTVEATAGPEGTIEAQALDLGERDVFALDDESPAEGWRAFVRGVVAELRRAGHALEPARLTISGDLARGSGLSSSAALEVALALALLAHSGADEPDRRALARLCSRVENDWVGAETGLLDQLAALCGQDDHAIRIDFRSLAIDAVELDLGDWRLVTLDSGVEHTHAASGYNERRR
jgi:galactokinase